MSKLYKYNWPDCLNILPSLSVMLVILEQIDVFFRYIMDQRTAFSPIPSGTAILLVGDGFLFIQFCYGLIHT